MGEEEIVFIDANIFLESALKDRNYQNCGAFINLIKDRKIKAVTSDFILYTCLLQIELKLKSVEFIKDFIISINSLEGLQIIRPSLTDMYNSVKISAEYKLDFDDSLVVSCMQSNSIKTLISFDKDFDKIKIIKRKEP